MKSKQHNTLYLSIGLTVLSVILSFVFLALYIAAGATDLPLTGFVILAGLAIICVTYFFVSGMETAWLKPGDKGAWKQLLLSFILPLVVIVVPVTWTTVNVISSSVDGTIDSLGPSVYAGLFVPPLVLVILISVIVFSIRRYSALRKKKEK